MSQSAGVLMFRVKQSVIEFFLVHPGGPFWKNKDRGAWSIPKGEFGHDEEPLAAAIREFGEETGMQLQGNFITLSPVKQRSGKWIHAYGLEGDLDPSALRSNTFSLEWPPRSGKYLDVPEVDRGEWFDYETAKEKLIPGQVAILDELYTLTKQLTERDRIS
jgi:predicted NUDIX family NTP pyrophosphohydrolase